MTRMDEKVRKDTAFFSNSQTFCNKNAFFSYFS